MNANTGDHLQGGIADDVVWKGWWQDLAVIPYRRYNALIGEFGRRFFMSLDSKLRGVRDRQCKSDRFIVFQTVILQ